MRESRGLSYEEVLCLLHHAAHADRLAWLEDEGRRVASLTLADAQEQQRVLRSVAHRINVELDRFHRKQPGTI